MFLIILTLLAILNIIIFFVFIRLGRQKQYVGNIVVIKNTGKTLYSLELDGNPEIIESRKDVTFKVVFPDVESDRE